MVARISKSILYHQLVGFLGGNVYINIKAVYYDVLVCVNISLLGVYNNLMKVALVEFVYTCGAKLRAIYMHG